MMTLFPKFVRRLGPEMKQVISHTSWHLVERILSMVLALFVSVRVARYLGPESFGKLSYAISFVGLFSVLAALWTNSILIRVLSYEIEQVTQFLGAGFYLRGLGSFLTLTLIGLTNWQVIPSADLKWMVAIVSIQLIFNPFLIPQLWFQANLIAKPIAAVRMIALVVTSIAKIGAIVLGAPLFAFAYIICLPTAIEFLGTTFHYFNSNQSFCWSQFNPLKAKSLLLESWPLILSGIGVLLYTQVDQIMLGQIAGSEELGYYSVAVSMSTIWFFIPVTVASSLFPSLLKAKKVSHQAYLSKSQQLFDIMVLISLLCGLPIFIFSTQLVNFLYGAEFSQSILSLQILILSGVFSATSIAKGQWLTCEKLTRLSFHATWLGALSNIGLNLYLIPIYGALGAAVATLVSYAIAAYFSCLLYAPTRQLMKVISRSLFLPYSIRRCYWIVRNTLKGRTVNHGSNLHS